MLYCVVLCVTAFLAISCSLLRPPSSSILRLPQYDIVDVGARKAVIAGVITDDSSIYPPSAKPTIVNPAEACIAVWGEAKEALGGGALIGCSEAKEALGGGVLMGCSEAKEALGGGECVCRVCDISIFFVSFLLWFVMVYLCSLDLLCVYFTLFVGEEYVHLSQQLTPVVSFALFLQINLFLLLI